MPKDANAMQDELDKLIPKSREFKLPDGSTLEIKPVMYGTELQLVEMFDRYTEGGGIDNFMNPVFVGNKEKAELLLNMIVLLIDKPKEWILENLDRDAIVEGILRFFVIQSRSVADRIIQMFGNPIPLKTEGNSEHS